MPELPSITIEDAEAAIRVLDVMRSLDRTQARDEAYRFVLTEVHQVIRHSRDQDNG